jgi:hypothetical protein
MDKTQKMESALEAVLMFYNTPYWTAADQLKWEAIVGVDKEATTKVLCDHIRSVLNEAAALAE